MIDFQNEVKNRAHSQWLDHLAISLLSWHVRRRFLIQE